MKTSLISIVMVCAVLAGCAKRASEDGAVGASGTQGSAAARGGAGQAGVPAEPGAQESQAGVLVLAAGQAGPAQGYGLPGAAAAQAGGDVAPQAGQQLAASGSPNGVTACAGCHGAQGEGNAAGGFPRIAGQSSYYLGKQLAAYANGARLNPIMAPIAKAMSAQQIRDVSAYYATLGGVPAAAKPAAATKGSARALQLAAAGDEAKHVQACSNCHGPGGTGEPPVYPYLAGQHPGYLTAAMADWKSGARKTDLSGQMTQIAQGLSDADVATLAAYFGAQAPPSQPAAKMVNVAAGSTLKPAVAAAPGAPGPRMPGGAGVQGTGTEQGAAVTGGSQGPGGGGGTQGTQPPAPPPTPIKR